MQDGLIAFGDQDIVPVPASDAPTEGMLGMQGIGTDDASFDQQRCQELRHDAQFILLLSGHLLFEDHASVGFIECELVHLLLIGRLMA
jgi:hypothetical protein